MDHSITGICIIFTISHFFPLVDANISVIFSVFLSVWVYEVKLFNTNTIIDNVTVLPESPGKETNKIRSC